ncbi:MAG: protein-L-isoaspartate(D-aspartate) O-methyltransferase [Desulfurococcales archaeon]|nr:protein-L-isoaspartate(D-aspartate) O-methyltransferase [Desulfurococcales archaeon]
MVEEVKAKGLASNPRVLEALMKVPRHLFVPREYIDMAYEDRPLPIGYGQTISAPGVVARIAELLDPQPGEKVLDVGTGSGYQAAVLAELVAPSEAPRESWGHVWSIEIIEELAEAAKSNLREAGYIDRVTVVVGDGSMGYEPEAPYHRIAVGAAAPRIPEPLVDQLTPGGRLVIPIGDRFVQKLTVVEKGGDGSVRVWSDIEVLFVPLTGRYGFREGGEGFEKSHLTL